MYVKKIVGAILCPRGAAANLSLAACPEFIRHT
jgi:hypothetical protein